MSWTRAALAIFASATLGHDAAGQPMPPPGMTHEQHLEQMQKDQALQQRGAEAMGFEQATTDAATPQTAAMLDAISEGATLEVPRSGRSKVANAPLVPVRFVRVPAPAMSAATEGWRVKVEGQ